MPDPRDATAPTVPMDDAFVANYLRRREYEIHAELSATLLESKTAHREKGSFAAEQILGPKRLREAAAARAKALAAAAAALDAEQTPVRKIEPRGDDRIISPFQGVRILARRVEPQPPSFAESRSQPYSFFRKSHWLADEWAIVGAVGFVREATGQSDWTCPLGGVGETVQIGEEWWEAIDVRVEREGGEGDWFWVATFRRAEMASFTSPV